MWKAEAKERLNQASGRGVERRGLVSLSLRALGSFQPWALGENLPAGPRVATRGQWSHGRTRKAGAGQGIQPVFLF